MVGKRLRDRAMATDRTITHTPCDGAEVAAAESASPDGNVFSQLQTMQRAVATILTGLGEDITRDGLLETPKRVAKAMAYSVRGYQGSASAELGTALFTEEAVALGTEEHANIVLVRDIEFFSTHAQDLMPFYGRAHVAYIPKSGQVVGLSKFARITEVYARRLQTPNLLAHQLAEALNDLIAPQGVAVIIQTRHLSHTTPDGIHGESHAAHGCFTNPVQLQEMMVLLGLSEKVARMNGASDALNSVNGTHRSNGCHQSTSSGGMSSLNTLGYLNGSTVGLPHNIGSHQNGTNGSMDSNLNTHNGVSDAQIEQLSGPANDKALGREAARESMEAAAMTLCECLLRDAASSSREHLSGCATSFVSNMLASTHGCEKKIPGMYCTASVTNKRGTIRFRYFSVDCHARNACDNEKPHNFTS